MCPPPCWSYADQVCDHDLTQVIERRSDLQYLYTSALTMSSHMGSCIRKCSRLYHRADSSTRPRFNGQGAGSHSSIYMP